jgi:hypothetical protein
MIAIKENRFTCHNCHGIKPIQTNGGTGYGIDQHGNKICYDCCAILDREQMILHGRVTLYLVKLYYNEVTRQWENEPSGKNSASSFFVTNWPGTLSFKCHYTRIGRHNIAGERIDVWFSDKSVGTWHGIHYGRSSDIVYCRRLNEG